MKALKKGVRSSLKNNGDKSLVTWKTSTGFTAFQNYSKSEKHTVKCSFAGKEHQLTYQLHLDKARIADHDKGISANFVHSQDAALLATVIARLADKGVTSFFMIHDQFSVDAENLDLMLETFRQVFKEIFEVDQLGKTLDSFGLEKGYLEYGDLDLEKILEAKYIIS